MTKFWQISKYFLDFKTKKNFFYTWEQSDTINQKLNKFVVKISVDLYFCFIKSKQKTQNSENQSQIVRNSQITTIKEKTKLY